MDFRTDLEKKIKADLGKKVSPKQVRRELGKLNIPELDVSSAKSAVDIRSAMALMVEERPARSPKEKAKRQQLIDTLEVLRPGAVLIVRHRVKSQTDSGIYKPAHLIEEQSRSTTTATIVKTAKDMGSDLKPGDYVYFSIYAPFSVEKTFEEVQIMHENDIICKLNSLEFFPDVEEA